MTYLKHEEFQKQLTHSTVSALGPGDEEATYNLRCCIPFLIWSDTIKGVFVKMLLPLLILLTKEPENITYLIQSRRCLFELGRFDEGLQCLDRALWINPKDGITPMNKGNCPAPVIPSWRNFPNTLIWLFHIIRSDILHPGWWNSWIHLDGKQLDTALFEIENAIKLSPTDSRARGAEGSHSSSLLGREDEARATLKRKAIPGEELTPDVLCIQKGIKQTEGCSGFARYIQYNHLKRINQVYWDYPV